MIKYPNGGVPDTKIAFGKDEKELFVPRHENVDMSLLPKNLRARVDWPVPTSPVLACIVVHGEPVQAGRPRFNSYTHTAHDPKKSRQYKAMVRESAVLQYHGDLITDKAIAVKIAIYRSIQKSISRKEHDRRATGEHRPIVKPDTSNYVKLIEDALTGVIWEDDNLIVSLVADKYYSDDPRIEVTVTEAGGMK